MLIIVPGVEAGMVPLLAGIITTGICKSETLPPLVAPGRRVGSITLPAPVTLSTILTAADDGTLVPVLIMLIGPKQTSPCHVIYCTCCTISIYLLITCIIESFKFPITIILKLLIYTRSICSSNVPDKITGSFCTTRCFITVLTRCRVI